jgi:regulator of cell morphogenesis and NO signaling
MQVCGSSTVSEIARESLAAVRIFEKYGIDYCCGGKRPLEEVCRDKGQDVEVVKRELEAATATASDSERSWATAPLTGLIDHIVEKHHGYLRSELPALEARLLKVFQVYNQRYGATLTGLPEVFSALRAELESHLDKEEKILFPAIAAGGSPGNVQHLIGNLETEHESAGAALAKIREITRNFEIPEYACVTYRALMNGLDELEHDLHLHIHLENNILFPRAERLGQAS